MTSPLQIALGGLAPGAAPITISTQGLIVTITPPEEQEDAQWIPLRSFGPPDATPFDSRKKKKKRIDALVHVEGCKATISTYKCNVARYTFDAKVAIPMATRFLETILEWREFNRWKALPKNAARRKEKARELSSERKKARHRRADANAFAGAIASTEPERIAKILHGVILENRRLHKLLDEEELFGGLGESAQSRRFFHLPNPSRQTL